MLNRVCEDRSEAGRFSPVPTVEEIQEVTGWDLHKSVRLQVSASCSTFPWTDDNSTSHLEREGAVSSPREPHDSSGAPMSWSFSAASALTFHPTACYRVAPLTDVTLSRHLTSRLVSNKLWENFWENQGLSCR